MSTYRNYPSAGSTRSSCKRAASELSSGDEKSEEELLVADAITGMGTSDEKEGGTVEREYRVSPEARELLQRTIERTKRMRIDNTEYLTLVLRDRMRMVYVRITSTHHTLGPYVRPFYRLLDKYCLQSLRSKLLWDEIKHQPDLAEQYTPNDEETYTMLRSLLWTPPVPDTPEAREASLSACKYPALALCGHALRRSVPHGIVATGKGVMFIICNQ